MGDDVQAETKVVARVRLRDATLAEIDPLFACVRQLGKEGGAAMDHERDGGTVTLATARRLLRQVGTLHRELSLDVRRATADLSVGAPAKLKFRWLSQRDVKEFLALEAVCYPPPMRWSAGSMARLLDDPNVVAIVAEIDEQLVGAVVAGLNRGDVMLMSIGVLPEFRRQKIGTALVGKVLRRLSARRPFLLAGALDDNLTGHKFLASLGFHCRGVEAGAFVPEGLDLQVYGFEFRWRPESEGSHE